MKIAPIKDTLTKIRSGILLSAAFCCLLFIYAPVEIFAGNSGSFPFGIGSLLKPMIPSALLAAAFLSLLFLLVFRLNEASYVNLLAVFFTVFIIMFVQGMFFSSSLPAFTGEEVDLSLFPRQNAVSLAIAVLSAALVIVLLKTSGRERFSKTVESFSILVIAFMLVASCVLSVRCSAGAKKEVCVPTWNHLTEMGSEENLVVIVLDNEDASHFSDEFEDFTYYSNAMSGYSVTKYSVPLILSGEWYENQCDYDEYLEYVFTSSPLVSALDGYSMGMYEEDIPFSGVISTVYENISPVSRPGFEHPLKFTALQLRLALFRYSPYILKSVFSVTPDEIYLACCRRPDSGDVFFWGNSEFAGIVKSRDFVSCGDRAFRFIHLIGAHAPFENGNYDSTMSESLNIVHDYLDRLRDSGFYDNSAIVILGDHGCEGDGITGRHNPVLLIKGIGERHSFRESDAPVSYADLEAAFESLLEGSSGDSVFDCSPGEIRERRFLTMYLDRDGTAFEYVSEGHASDLSSMVSTGHSYPPYK